MSRKTHASQSNIKIEKVFCIPTPLSKRIICLSLLFFVQEDNKKIAIIILATLVIVLPYRFYAKTNTIKNLTKLCMFFRYLVFSLLPF